MTALELKKQVDSYYENNNEFYLNDILVMLANVVDYLVEREGKNES